MLVSQKRWFVENRFVEPGKADIEKYNISPRVLTNFYKMFRLDLTLPISSAPSEWSISAARKINTRLKTSTEQDNGNLFNTRRKR